MNRPVRAMIRTARFFVLCIAAACVQRAVAEEVQSGPAADATVPPLTVSALESGGGFEQLDVAATAAQKPLVCVLIRGDRWDRPVARMLSVLDSKLRESSAQARIVAVWLTSDVSAARDYLPRVAQSLQPQHTSYAVFEEPGGVPEGWGVSDDAQVTVAILHGGKVARAFGLVSANENDVAKIGEALRSAVAAH